ncbi:D-alanyl-D-alanine carboxypeptidase/D-alanyl-D-alanine-endopeptidase [Actinobacteria bacterium YIM 96077]|uniref:D-alanyl-D-alanine carboxypeptidase/D-alanyl-D-alanine-endopeptidase n=1 Tax=Phytoactinopolyspora halophila TaxID=1981511 RepID=A0A329QH54_9ACTN|nr:D-alanyl-D-alanine carboxypeptidase/D-alanyl-D-alanine-endopeptidase [Phytoactinopolyspora halophila]AYY14669.1 D-alanyl-D-alanine carboxypeptidase/D-alanyl-D-alanine-endopeptidase [Actinobacteria bacterium YIM 96077]RAW11620.1 D-alanyl-D-alanine carboxypeptidase/D-alanyl-D-alanine-endopeptidase [Phytoactinopolyspora halophila]
MSGRKIAVIGGSVLVAGCLTAVGLYATDTLPTESREAKAGASVPKGPIHPNWDTAGAVLETSAVEEASASSTGDLGDALEDLLDEPALGESVGVSVVPLGGGDAVYRTDADGAHTPASTLKILTGTAVLDVLAPDHRFVTRVVLADQADGEEVEITLVGGGDPLLASTEDETSLPGAASLDELATATAAALDDAGASAARVTFDDGLFSGPAVDPDWRSTYVPGGVVGPVNALSVDGARATPGMRERVDDPARTAAERFSDMLDASGIDVRGDDPERVTADPQAPDLASVSSPRLSTIVEYMMSTSNNDVAEALFRHVAVGRGQPGTSEDASGAVTDVIAGLGVDMDGVRILDGSGLARGNTVTASSLVTVLGIAADAERPDLRPVLTGLPVSGFNGTLADRAVDNGAGYVRAKTGTLTGVHSLAGLAVTAQGTVYVFALLADDADHGVEARAALDEFAAALVS